MKMYPLQMVNLNNLHHFKKTRMRINLILQLMMIISSRMSTVHSKKIATFYKKIVIISLIFRVADKKMIVTLIISIMPI
jgi:hypothetical protein